MFSKIRKRITYANIALTITLVFAMSGGAYAASKYLITSTKQINPKVLKALAGKTGGKGTTGPSGPAGPTGAKGETGTPGIPGKEGAPGKEGTPGKEGKQGKEGKEGPEGSPWTAGGTLPSGKTEAGAWGISAVPGSFGVGAGAVEFAFAQISFPIPLATALSEDKVHIIPSGDTGAGAKTCPTTSNVIKPEAEPGNLCIFERTDDNVESVSMLAPGVEEEEGAGTTGVVARVEPETKGASVAISGTWAVTAE